MKRTSPLRHQNILLAFAVSLLVMGCALLALARQQTTPNKPPADPAERPKFKAMVEAIDQRARELGLISVSDDPDQEAFVRRRRLAQLNEDFEKLYSINMEKIASQASATAFDYKTLADATADLKTRASRIKQGVAILQVVDKGEKPRYEENPDNLPMMVPELSRLINAFLGSPIFRLSSPNDAALRVKASRDLDGIIRLSDTINKIAKRSTRSAGSK
jgi:hypothetical protein